MKSTASIGLLGLCLAALCAAQEAAQPTAPAKPAAEPRPAQPKLGFEDIESVFSVGVFYWRPMGRTFVRGGTNSTDPGAQGLDNPGNPKYAPGVMITIPTGHSNRVEVSAFETRVNGNTTAPRQLTLFGETYDKDTYLASGEKIRNIKGTWNYLSYPYPPLDAKFRVKTLWEFQYVGVYENFRAPFTDTVLQSSGKRSIVLPTVGAGMEWVPSLKHFRFEARGSGMGFPGHSRVLDGDAGAVLRLGNLEVSAAARIFHFRTSPKNQHYATGTLWGPMASVRWVFR